MFLTASIGLIVSAQKMHESILTNVLRWPMELFDTTPMGRILNRFSKDVDCVDNVLPHCIRAWLMTFFGVNLPSYTVCSISSFLFELLFLMHEFDTKFIISNGMEWN